MTEGGPSEAPFAVRHRWFGRTPSHWDAVPLKRSIRVLGGGTPSKDDESYWLGDIPWASPKDIKVSLVLDTEDHISARALRDSATQLVPANSVLVVFRSGILRHTLPSALSGRELALNQDLKALVCGKHLDPRFLQYLLAGLGQRLLTLWRKQGATVESLDLPVVVRTVFPQPPIREQRAIADYLDRETARIDALIEKKQRLLIALAEAQPVAASMVLLGTSEGPGPLHANWPAAWGRIPFRWLFLEVDERSADGSEELMSVSQTRGVIAQAELGDRRQFAETLTGYKICRKDDLVINRMWVYYGALGVAPGLGLVSPDYSVFRSRGQLRTDLASYILRTPPYVGEMTRLVRGVGAAFQGAVRKPRLHPRELGQIVMPVPPKDEQERLIADLVRHSNQLVERVRLVERSVALLQERRQALITAAVTGELDIPEAA